MNRFLVEKFGKKLRVHAVEAKVNNTTSGSKYYFPDDQILRDSRIVAFFVPLNPNGDTLSITDRPIINDNLLNNASITLFYGNGRYVEDLPLISVSVGKDQTEVKPFEIPCFSPSKSYVTIRTNGTITTGESVQVLFIYLED